MLNSADTKKTNKHNNLQPSRRDNSPFVAKSPADPVFRKKYSKAKLHSRRRNQHRTPKCMDFFDDYEYPIGAANLSKLCKVNIRTAERWLAGTSKPSQATARLIQLTQRQRIMPETWPHHWRIQSNGALDIGHTKIALHPNQIEWYFYSVGHWHDLMQLLPEIEKRMQLLESKLPLADVIDFTAYREKLRFYQERDFLLNSWSHQPQGKNA